MANIGPYQFRPVIQDPVLLEAFKVRMEEWLKTLEKVPDWMVIADDPNPKNVRLYQRGVQVGGVYGFNVGVSLVDRLKVTLEYCGPAVVDVEA